MRERGGGGECFSLESMFICFRLLLESAYTSKQ